MKWVLLGILLLPIIVFQMYLVRDTFKIARKSKARRTNTVYRGEAFRKGTIQRNRYTIGSKS